MSACTKVKIKLNLTLKTDNIFFPILFLSQIDLTWMIFFFQLMLTNLPEMLYSYRKIHIIIV